MICTSLDIITKMGYGTGLDQPMSILEIINYFFLTVPGMGLGRYDSKIVKNHSLDFFQFQSFVMVFNIPLHRLNVFCGNVESIFWEIFQIVNFVVFLEMCFEAFDVLDSLSRRI